MKRAILTLGVVAIALCCMGIVYIDSVQHFLRFNSGAVQLVVSNNVIATVNTNTLNVTLLRPLGGLGNILTHSNTVFTNVTLAAATNSTANTNITVNYDQGVRHIILTNNASFTNHSGLEMGKSKSVILILEPTLVNRTFVWPSLGVPSFGGFWRTNINAPIFSTGTAGVVYVLSITTYDTNQLVSMTIW